MMSWSTREDENGVRQTLEYRDTPLQLAWRMQYYKMYDLIKARLDEIDPGLAVKQITKDFQGEPSDCVDEYADKLQGVRNAIYNQQWDEAEKRWNQSVGQVALRTWHDMSHVMHWKCTEGSGFWENKFDKPFEFKVAETRLHVGTLLEGRPQVAGRGGVTVQAENQLFAALKSKLATDRNKRLSQLSSVKQEEPVLPGQIFDR